MNPNQQHCPLEYYENCCHQGLERFKGYDPYHISLKVTFDDQKLNQVITLHLGAVLSVFCSVEKSKDYLDIIDLPNILSLHICSKAH